MSTVRARLPLVTAAFLAEQVAADLAPHCERLQIAGSVRRQKETVGDLELVAIPRWDPAGLFGNFRRVNALHAHLQASPTYQWLKGDNPDGRYYQLRLPAHGDLVVDLFLASADNFGLILLIRTGSADFSARALARWKTIQGLPPARPGCVDGRLVTASGERVATPEEQDVFDRLEMAFVPPEWRE